MGFARKLIMPFSPKQISGLVLWLDGADPNGTGSLPSNGSSISSWKDKSGNGNNATQGTGANQPDFNTNKANNLGALTVVQSSTQYMTGTITGLAANPNLTVFVVCSSTTTAANPVVFGIGSVNANYQSIGVGINAGFTTFQWGGNSSIFSPANTNLNILSITENNSSNVNNVFINTVGQTSSSGVAGALTLNTTYSVGRHSNPTGTAAWDGLICEVIVYNSVLSATQIAAVTKYLSAKWNIETLPLSASGLKLWLNASNPVGTSNLPADSTAISTWFDLSLTNNNLTQSTGSFQPLLKQSILNNRAVVRFDGVNDILQKLSATPLSTKNTFFIVGTINDNGSSRGTFFDYSTNTTTNTGTNFLVESGPDYQADFYDGSLHTANSSNIILPQTGIFYIYNDGSNGYIFKNGIQIASVATGNTDNSGSRAYTLGSLVALTATYFLNGDIAEVLFYSGQLSISQISTILAYLSSKYGITVTL